MRCGRWFVQHARRRLDAVGQHDDCRLRALWSRARIDVLGGVGRGGVALPRLVEKVRDRSRAVMLRDERLQRARKLVLRGERQPFLDVISNDLRARARAENVVRVASLRLILDEVLWSSNLADVVVVRADASEQRVRADRPTGCLGEIRHRDGVRVGARRLETQTLQQRTIQVRPFQQRQVGLDAGERLDHRQQQDGEKHAAQRIEHAEARRDRDFARRQVERQVRSRPP